MIKTIHTDKAPAAIGPYSQGIAAGGMVFTSGQIPCDPETGAIVGVTIEEQAEQVMKNLSAVLEAAGASCRAIIKTTCFLQDMKDFSAFNAIYSSYITEKPARSCVAVAALPKGVLCEVEAIAAIEA